MGGRSKIFDSEMKKAPMRRLRVVVYGKNIAGNLGVRKGIFANLRNIFGHRMLASLAKRRIPTLANVKPSSSRRMSLGEIDKQGRGIEEKR